MGLALAGLRLPAHSKYRASMRRAGVCANVFISRYPREFINPSIAPTGEPLPDDARGHRCEWMNQSRRSAHD